MSLAWALTLPVMFAQLFLIQCSMVLGNVRSRILISSCYVMFSVSVEIHHPPTANTFHFRELPWLLRSIVSRIVWQVCPSASIQRWWYRQRVPWPRSFGLAFQSVYPLVSGLRCGAAGPRIRQRAACSWASLSSWVVIRDQLRYVAVNLVGRCNFLIHALDSFHKPVTKYMPSPYGENLLMGDSMKGILKV